MILKNIDFLSPEIALFYNGSSSHSSIISGILSLITCLIIICISIYKIGGLFYREKETPIVTSYNRFVEEPGEYTLNSLGLFHFISIIKDINYEDEIEFDYTAFNLVGLETYLQDFEFDNNLFIYNHWIYGFCNNESDTQGISHIVNYKFFTKSSCIRQYIIIVQLKNIIKQVILIFNGQK